MQWSNVETRMSTRRGRAAARSVQSSPNRAGLLGEARLEGRAVAIHAEGDPHEELAGQRVVELRGLGDVSAVGGQPRGDRGDDAGAILAAQGQDVLGHGQVSEGCRSSRCNRRGPSRPPVCAASHNAADTHPRNPRILTLSHCGTAC